jgi:hypothetical protein
MRNLGAFERLRTWRASGRNSFGKKGQHEEFKNQLTNCGRTDALSWSEIKLVVTTVIRDCGSFA